MPRMEDTQEDVLKQAGKRSLIREILDLRTDNATLVDALRSMRWWLDVLAKEIDLDEDETVVSVNAVGPDGKRELASISLRQIYERADAALKSATA